MSRLEMWKRPDCYAGESWEGWHVFLRQNRDSDCLTRVNFTVALESLGGESETVRVVRESHWACGWVEWIAIREGDYAAVTKARHMLAKLDQHPVLDEDRWADQERQEADENWGPDDVRRALRDAGAREETLSRFTLDRDDAQFILGQWLSEGADYEIRDEGGPFYRFHGLTREHAAHALRWLRSGRWP